MIWLIKYLTNVRDNLDTSLLHESGTLQINGHGAKILQGRQLHQFDWVLSQDCTPWVYTQTAAEFWNPSHRVSVVLWDGLCLQRLTSLCNWPQHSKHGDHDDNKKSSFLSSFFLFFLFFYSLKVCEDYTGNRRITILFSLANNQKTKQKNTQKTHLSLFSPPLPRPLSVPG